MSNTQYYPTHKIETLTDIPSRFLDSTYTIGRIEEGTISMTTPAIEDEHLELVVTPDDFSSIDFYLDGTAHEMLDFNDGVVEIRLHTSL